MLNKFLKMSFDLLRFVLVILAVLLSRKNCIASAAVRYIVDEQEPLVWCDEDYPILDANDPIDANFVNDVDDEYY